MLLQFLLEHGIDHRAPFRSRNRRIRHDGLIYVLSGHPGATTQADTRWSVSLDARLARAPVRARTSASPRPPDHRPYLVGRRYRKPASPLPPEGTCIGRVAGREPASVPRDTGLISRPDSHVRKPFGCHDDQPVCVSWSLTEWPARGLSRRGHRTVRPALQNKSGTFRFNRNCQ